VETNINEEIATLRVQITAAEEEIRALKAEAPAEDVGLGELVAAHASMLTRLSRLMSCKRTLD